MSADAFLFVSHVSDDRAAAMELVDGKQAIDKNPEQALFWYRNAADLGHAEASAAIERRTLKDAKVAR